MAFDERSLGDTERLAAVSWRARPPVEKPQHGLDDGGNLTHAVTAGAASSLPGHRPGGTPTMVQDLPKFQRLVRLARIRRIHVPSSVRS